MKHLLFLLTAVLLVAGSAKADSITLRESARADGAAVKLHEVAQLEGDLATALADVEVATFAAGQDMVTVGMATIRKRLTAHEIHWGKVTCRGAQQITVRRQIDTAAATKQPSATITTAAGTALANPVASMNAGHSPIVQGTTLKDRLLAWLIQTIGGNAADLRLTCLNPTEPAWRMTELAGRFEFEPVGRDLVGRTTVIVRQYRPDETVSTVRVSVKIERRVTVVKAVADLQRGQILTTADVETTQFWQTSAMRRPVGEAADIVGQAISRNVRKGDVIAAADVASPTVVRRGQLVTVRVVSGSLVLRSVLRAREDGAVGQLIRLTNEKTRQTVDARVTGPQEAVLIVRRGGERATVAQGGES
jgi:flagella basal body P-ring formation protein FlgA